MNHDPEQRSRPRENMLAVALAAFVGGMMLFFLYLISFGIVGNVLAGVGLLVLVATLHYLVWGRSLTEETAAEREAARRADLADSPLSLKAPPEAIQDLSRTQGIQKN